MSPPNDPVRAEEWPGRGAHRVLLLPALDLPRHPYGTGDHECVDRRVHLHMNRTLIGCWIYAVGGNLPINTMNSCSTTCM